MSERKPLLELKKLKKYFQVRRGVSIKAVEDVSFTIYQGEKFGIVGESGCGKTTTGRCIIRLYKPTGGEVYFNGKLDCSPHTFISCDRDAVLKFGDSNRINFGCRFIANKEIVFGDKVRISWDCTFIDSDYHPIIDMVRGKPLKVSQPIKIEYGCWIGHNSIVSKGAKLPKNTTVCAGSVVKGRFSQENTIMGGNIAKVLDEGYVRDDV